MSGLIGDDPSYDHDDVTPDEHRRRIDEVLDRTFLNALGEIGPEVLRERLRDARSEEDAVSYIRRNLHGRLDLLRAELESRRGGEDRRPAVDALLTSLASAGGSSRGTHAGLGLRAAAVAGRRRAEQILGEDHLARLPDLEDDEIEDIAARVERTERQLSDQRHRLHEVIEVLEAELARRYKSGLELSLERLQ